MSLASFTPATAKIMHRDTVAFEVRGLSLSDLSLLMRTHLPDLQIFVGMWGEYQASGPSADMTPLLTSMAAEAPVVVSQLIALGCGEPDMAEAASRLPIPLQIDALANIFRLTFDEYGGLEKTLAALGMLARGFGVTLPQAPSKAMETPADPRAKKRK